MHGAGEVGVLTSLSATEVRDNFFETANRVAYRKERVIVERRGKALAAIVPIEDAELLAALEDRIDLEEARKALTAPENRERVAWGAVKQRLGL